MSDKKAVNIRAKTIHIEDILYRPNFQKMIAKQSIKTAAINARLYQSTDRPENNCLIPHFKIYHSDNFILY